MDRYKTILLFGAPGSGKGTQGKIIGTIPGFLHNSTGDIFRSLDLASPVGRKFQEYAGRGQLVPDEFTISLWKQYLTGKALDGLYLTIGEEERKIRSDPVGTGSAILKKVFGSIR